MVAPAVIWVAAPAGPIGMAAEAAAAQMPRRRSWRNPAQEPESGQARASGEAGEAEHHRGSCNSSGADEGEACADGE